VYPLGNDGGEITYSSLVSKTSWTVYIWLCMSKNLRGALRLLRIDGDCGPGNVRVSRQRLRLGPTLTPISPVAMVSATLGYIMLFVYH
jgi:hypothetical protein